MMKTDPDICVCNPVTEKFTTFEILIKTSNPAFNLRQSSTRRRYNDFCWLRKILKKHHPLCTCPDLPEKKKFAQRFEIQFLVQRMKELEDWLQSIVSVSLFLSDTALHLFLQSCLTCKQIEQYLNGNLPESTLQQAYKDAEPHINNETSSSSLEESIQDDTSGSAGGSGVCVGATAGQSSPVVIRTRPPAVLHNNMQERSDSGIDGLESDVESSYDSQGSPYVSSLDSGMIPDKYPPLTEVSQVLSNKNSNKGRRENESFLSDSNSDSGSVKVSKHKANAEADENSEIKIAIVSDNSCDTDVQINVTCVETKVIASEHSVNSDMNKELVQDSSNNAEESENLAKEDANIKGKQVTRKVEMGVLFC